MNSFRHLHQPTGRIIAMDQREYLFFGGTAYLGFLVNPEYQLLVKEGIQLYGLNNGTSRSNNVQLGIYDEAEAVLAARFGYADTALFSSGYLAAQATVKSLALNGKIYYAPNSHPALWIADKPNVLAEDFSEWITSVVKEINDSSEENFVIIANAIDNLKPELYDFSPLKNIKHSKKVILILDDSHGLGVVNKDSISANILALSACTHIDVVVVASLAKGLGTDAGLVLGDKEVIAKIKQCPIFMGASPSSPAFIYALVKSQAIYNEAFDKLQQNIRLLSSYLKPSWGINHVSDFPVFTSINSNLYRHLYQNDILISSFPYPLPTSALLNRIVISALHSENDIQKLTEVLQSHV
ncbi:aminotransferase class I/II-fold pyridoxal phosphate-dependent enzyme [Sphingobacterium sp. DN04309]|uniref:Aminotransferase class I/II-fold pyridoxal phosphate-dependent enzyme n=2 Tax=Sphingobacterium litopenaei TaxID=2763500 RepID=A0ABR7YBW1_9SPHI|nr:aminotransferase class I/II-fold pyridoxal phosphate-dependent enzyme [Sphingobacterium litopenaei]